MLTGMEMMSCPNLAVPATVMQHIVNVESSANPFAIGVVGGQLIRQPQNQDEAIATAQMLEAKGYNYSIGIAQVNRNNLTKYGLDSYEKAFSLCGNLQVGSRILAECYTNAGGDWGKAFSCYYSGNYVTGFRTGYVRRVFDSIGRASPVSTPAAAQPIQLASDAASPTRITPLSNGAPVITSNAAYRVAIRSQLIDNAVNAMVAPAAAKLTDARVAQPLQGAPAPATGEQIEALIAQAAQQDGAANRSAPKPDDTDLSLLAVSDQSRTKAMPAGSPSASRPDDDSVFVPRVRGPKDPIATTGAPDGSSQSALSAPAGDPADLRGGNRDAALVF